MACTARNVVFTPLIFQLYCTCVRILHTKKHTHKLRLNFNFSLSPPSLALLKRRQTAAMPGEETQQKKMYSLIPVNKTKKNNNTKLNCLVLFFSREPKHPFHVVSHHHHHHASTSFSFLFLAARKKTRSKNKSLATTKEHPAETKTKNPKV